MHLFIAEIKGEKAFLDTVESHHLTKVLRLKAGAIVGVTDACGNLFEAEVALAHPKNTVLNLLKSLEYTQKRDYYLHIAVAPTKQMDRVEWFLEKSIEIGVDEVSFLEVFHSERRHIKTERLEKVAIAAMKQSLKAEKAKINDLSKFNQFIQNHKNFNGQKFIAHCDTQIEKTPIKEAINPKDNYLFLIGPEGDFSKEEITFAIENGFMPISLGEQRMRTETAALNTAFIAGWVHSI